MGALKIKQLIPTYGTHAPQYILLPDIILYTAHAVNILYSPDMERNGNLGSVLCPLTGFLGPWQPQAGMLQSNRMNIIPAFKMLTADP